MSWFERENVERRRKQRREEKKADAQRKEPKTRVKSVSRRGSPVTHF